MLPHPLTFKYKSITKINLDSTTFILEIICLRINDGAYVVNRDEYADVSTQWIALYVKNIDIIYFGSSGVEHFPKEIQKFIGHKNIKTNIFRIQ